MIPFHEARSAPNLEGWLKKRKAMHYKGHEDTLIVVCGGEQVGKSRFTLRATWDLFSNKIYKDGKYNLDHIVFDGPALRKRLFDSSKSIVHDDEAITHLYSRQAMTEENVKCNKSLAQCGYKHNIVFLLIPNFFVIDSYIREHRVHAVVKVFRGNKFKAWIFTKNKRKLQLINKKKSFAVSPSTKGWWAETDSTPEYLGFVKAYRKKEDTEKKKSGEDTETPDYKKAGETRSLMDVKKEMAFKLWNKGVTQATISEATGASLKAVSNWVKKWKGVIELE